MSEKTSFHSCEMSREQLIAEVDKLRRENGQMMRRMAQRLNQNNNLWLAMQKLPGGLEVARSLKPS